ncbi:MAG: histidine kinase N-terminal 7TM domain-containing protein, partial [Steroidobacteraceae bacterium]
MLGRLELVLPTVFGFAALLYLWLAMRVSRASPQNPNNAISYFLFLIGALVGGSAFSLGGTDPHLYGVGRMLSFFASGFLPLVLYCIYREYTVGRTHPLMLALLAVVPVASTLLALTNP